MRGEITSGPSQIPPTGRAVGSRRHNTLCYSDRVPADGGAAPGNAIEAKRSRVRDPDGNANRRTARSTSKKHDLAVDTDERPFLDHIIELRARLLKALLAVLVLFFPLYYFANDLYVWVAAPLMSKLPAGGEHDRN